MDALPDELLLQIFEIVSEQFWEGKWILNTHRRTRNLHRLSLVSRRFNRIVTPMLYKQIRGSQFLSNPFWRQIVYTLHQNYDLAQLIHSFSMTKRPEHMWSEPPDRLRSESLLSLLPMLYCYNSFTLVDLILELEHRLKRGDNVFATFFVLQAPALTKLELIGFENNDGYSTPKQLPLVVEEMGRAIFKDVDAGMCPRCFGSLRDLRIDLSDWGYFHPRAVIPFMYLPQLKRLTLEGWGIQSERSRNRRLDAFGPRREWPARSSAVEEIVINYGYGSAYQMNKLLSACTTLRSFEYKPQATSSHKLLPWFVQVSDALISHAGTLESIIIDHTEHSDGLPEPFQHTAEWASLRMLQIPHNLLFANKPRWNVTEYLPPSLEYLVLYATHKTLADRGTDIEAFVVEVSDAIYKGYLDGSLPCLKGIELTLDWSYTGDQTIEHKIPFPDVRSVISAFDDHQIKLGVSMYACYRNEAPPTKEEMQILKTLFPGITAWCKGHKILRVSTYPEPCVPGYKHMDNWGSGPWGWIWKEWDFENDPESVLPEE